MFNKLTRNNNDYTVKPTKDFFPFPELSVGSFQVGIALSRRCIEMAMRLRFQVFNMELAEGLDQSYSSGLDQDEFDDQMFHLVIIHKTDGVVGTYRMQTCDEADAGLGYYSDREFDLAPLRDLLTQSIELGRACISLAHRTPRVLSLLWQGLRRVGAERNKRWLYGCCSLTSQVQMEGWKALELIQQKGWAHESLILRARPGHTCRPMPTGIEMRSARPTKIPKLFKAYLRIGTRVISEPAIDREFGTIDFLVMCDLDSILFVDSFANVTAAEKTTRRATE